MYFSEHKNKRWRLRVLAELMKISLRHILSLSCIAIMVFVQPASAQESSLPENEYIDVERDKYERERIINSPGEGSDFRYYPRTSSTTPTTPTVTKDSVESKPATPAPVVANQKAKTVTPVKPQEKVPTKPEDDSILSFNFLYYIIQKYKLQDIVD